MSGRCARRRASPAPALPWALRTLAGVALLLACAVGGGTPDGSRDAIVSGGLPGTLRIGTSGDYPPFSRFADADSHALSPVRGFDVDLVEALARDLGVVIEWVPFRWPELAARVAGDAFDVVASGVTWRPERAVTGWMTRATAVGGPCVVGNPAPARVAVNRGGVLERFARVRFADAEILALEDNLALGPMMTQNRVDAIVTDSFERRHLGIAPSVPFACAPKTDRKVLWIAPARAGELGPRIDAWLAAHEEEIDDLRARWLGGPAPRSDVDHLVDLLARRLAYMPAVAAWKRERGVAIEDPAREAAVRERARADARHAGLDPASVAALFIVQMELGKRLQADAARTSDSPAGDGLDLGGQIRPELVRLGARIVAALASLAPLRASALDAADWVPLAAWLDPSERARLRAALLAVVPGTPQTAAD